MEEVKNSSSNTTTVFADLVDTDAHPEVMYQYRNGLAALLRICKASLLWLREQGELEPRDLAEISNLYDEQDLFKQQLTPNVNAVENIQRYRDQRPRQ